MKKALLSVLALSCSLATLAQAPTTPDARRADKEYRKEAKIKLRGAHGDDDHNGDHDGDKAGKPANHGQNVSAFAKSTTLTGADKGAAISSVARGGHGVDHDLRNARSARGGERGHGGRPAGSGHQGGGHSMGGGHHGNH